jgi:hypothetical protein
MLLQHARREYKDNGTVGERRMAKGRQREREKKKNTFMPSFVAETRTEAVALRQGGISTHVLSNGIIGQDKIKRHALGKVRIE